MSEQPTQNVEADAISSPDESKGSKKLIIIVLAVVLLLGGGGGAGFYFMTRPSAEESAGKSDKKSKSDSADEEEPPAEESEKKSSKSGKSIKSVLPNDDDVDSIVELQPFIVNLADTDSARYLRMSVSLGIGKGEGAEKPEQLFITRVRNAMLVILSDKASSEILSMEGKAKLRKDLLKAAQAAADEPSIEAIYITDFIVQL